MATQYRTMFPGLAQSIDRGKSQAYNAELERYRIERELYDKEQLKLQRMADYEAINPQIEIAMEGMTPERRNLLKLNQAMMQTESFFDKGLSGMDRGIGQRGVSISDIIKSGLKTKSSNEIQQYKVDNPEDSRNIQNTKYYASLGGTPPTQQDYRDSVRARQFLKTDTDFQDPLNPNTPAISRNVAKAVTLKETAKSNEEFSSGMNDLMSTYEQSTLDIGQQRKKLDDIEANSGFLNDGLIGSALSNIAGTGAFSREKDIKTFQSEEFKRNIKQMKGLGALSDAEGTRLESQIEMLDIGLDEESLIKKINSIRAMLSKGERKMARDRKRDIKRFKAITGKDFVMEPALEEEEDTGGFSIKGVK